MSTSVWSFSLSSSSDENPKSDSGSDSGSKDPITSANSADSAIVTNDAKDIVDSADSGFNVRSKADQNAKTRRVLLFLAATVLIHATFMFNFHIIHDFIVRHLFHGPTRFQIHSASLSAFSTTSWWSQQIIADGNISFSAKNIFIREKIVYDFIEVSVLQNHTLLSSNVLPSFDQNSGRELQLKVRFSAKIDTSVATDFVKSDDSVSLNVVIRGKVCPEKSRKWSKNFTASCKNLVLQFLPGSEKAEMRNEGPIICQSRNGRIFRKIYDRVPLYGL